MSLVNASGDKATWQCVALVANEYAAYRLNKNDDAECQTSYSKECQIHNNLASCNEMIPKSTQVITCGDALFNQTKVTTGYDTPSSWCSVLIKSWSPNDARVYTCRWWNRQFIATRVNEAGNGECFALDKSSCLTFMDSSQCENELKRIPVKSNQPLICDTSPSVSTSDTSSWCYNYQPPKTVAPTTIPVTIVPLTESPSTIAPTQTPIQTPTESPSPVPTLTQFDITSRETPVPTESSKSLHFGLILTICAALAVASMIIVSLWRRKFIARRIQRAATAHVNLGTVNAYRLENSELVLTKLLVRGDTSEVHLGMFKEQIVAVKRITSVDVQVLEQFIQEITLQASLKCPFVVDCLGACWEDSLDMTSVMEYMDCRDLKLYLATHDKESFPWAQKLQCIQDLVQGLVFLHDMPRIHGALRSKCVLIDSVKGTKISRFGLLDGNTSIGSYQWIAPEVLVANNYSRASDIYSLGVILSEFETHQQPYLGMINEMTGKPLPDTAIMSLIQQGRVKPTFTNEMPKWLSTIAMSCLAHDPTLRPTAENIANSIRKGLLRRPSKIGILV